MSRRSGNVGGVPFLAVGNDELGDAVGEAAVCPNCGEEHPVEYGEKVTRDEHGVETRTPSRLLGIVRCAGKAYLVAVDGRLLPPRAPSG